MKKYTLLIFVFIILSTSCSLDDNGANNFSVEFLPIESVDVPELFVYGEIYDISMTYIKPNSCFEFHDFFYNINGNERIVAIENIVYSNQNCTDVPESVTVSFEFSVTGTETYVFKFYQGKDEQGVDQYHIVEVPVSED